VVVAGIGASERGADVARTAAVVAERLGFELTLLHVEPPPVVAAAPHVGYAAAWPEDAAADLGTVHVWLEALAAEAGVPAGAELRVEVGRPAERLLAAAGHGAELLVVGQSGPKRPFRRGGIVRTLVAEAPCPVLVVPRAASGATERLEEWQAASPASPSRP